jgi:hypothetical protein
MFLISWKMRFIFSFFNQTTPTESFKFALRVSFWSSPFKLRKLLILRYATDAKRVQNANSVTRGKRRLFDRRL